MARTDIDEKIDLKNVGVVSGVAYTPNNTIAELIEGLRGINNYAELENNLSLKKALEYILGTLSNDLERVVKDLEKIIADVAQKSGKSPNEIENETIDEFKEEEDTLLDKDVEEVFDIPPEPETRLSQLELDELVLEYETASENRKKRIEALLEKYENVKPDAVKQFIEKQREILLENKKIEVSRAEKFADELAKDGKTEEEKIFIKDTVLKVINGEEIPKSVETKEIKLKTEEFIEKNRAELKEEKIQKINQAFVDAENNAPDDQKELIHKYGENLIKLNRAETPNIQKNMSNIKVMMEVNGESPGVLARAESDVNVLLKSIYTDPAKLKNIYNDIKSLDVAGLQQKYLPNIPEVRSFQSFIRAVDADKDAVLGLQSMVNAKIKMVEGVGKFVTKWVPNGGALVGKVSEKIGGIAIKEFLTGAMEVIAKEGLATGAKTIMQGIMLGSTSAAEAAGGSAMVTTMATLFAALTPAAVAILVAMAAIFAYKIAYKIYDIAAGWIHSATGVNFLWGVRDFFTGIFGDNWFGRTVGTLGQFAFNSAMTFGAVSIGFMSFLAKQFAFITVPITGIIIGLVSVFSVLGLISGGMVSSLVPPPPQGAGGRCWVKEGGPTQGPSTGVINCNQGTPNANIAISKETFAIKAGQWKSGKNYASECFNDVVNRAQCAGVNPLYALAAWLHESGASNYGISNVEDFGIHGNSAVPARNFDKQINWFLKLNLGQRCPGLDYWTSFGTNYLTGGCDPTKLICQDNTLCGGKSSDQMKAMVTAGTLELGIDVQNGESYKNAFLNTFKLMDVAVPASALGSKGGQNCGANSTSTAVATANNEFVNSEGVLMECSGPVDENGNFVGNEGDSAYDPNAPGLEGIKVEGECSVANKVVETKQCGQSYSSMGLPGGSGTICSAGCGPSSVSSLVKNINSSMTPNSIIFEPGSEYAGMNGSGSDFGQATRTLEKWFPGKVTNNAATQSCDQRYVAEQVCQGKAVMMLTYSDNGKGGAIGHFLVAIGVSNGDILVMDPFYSNRTPFATKGAGNIKQLRGCITVKVK